MKHLPFSLLVVLLLVGTPPVLAQPDTSASALPPVPALQADARGIPFPSEHYAPEDYGQAPRNWDIVQDHRGLTYVANSDGVLQYDGERWRTVLPAQTSARSLAADSLVHVGLKGDFGYLRPDTAGRLRYKSLYDQVPEGRRDFGDVWKTHVVDGAAYYQTHKYLFRWDGTSVKAWSSDNQFHTTFVLDDTLYVRARGRGLLRMAGDSLVLAEGGGAFSDRSVHVMAPHPSGDVLLGTEENGLYLYDGETLEPFAPELTPYLQKHTLYHGTRLPGNRYVLATLGGGALVLDARGRLLRVLDATTGLPDEVVNYVYVGREGELWLALHNDGVYRADLNSPTTLYDQRTGLKGVIQDIHSHPGTTYVATGRALYVRSNKKEHGLEERSTAFEQRPSVPLTKELLSVGDTVLAATGQGVYRVDGTLKKITDTYSSTLSKTDDERTVYVGTRQGLTVLQRTDGGWQSVVVDGIDSEISAVSSGPDGTVWLTTEEDVVLRVTLSSDGRQVLDRVRFDEGAGLPSGYRGPLFLNDEITLFTGEGLYRVQNPADDPHTWQFAPSPALLPSVAGADTLRLKSVFFREDERTIWTSLGNRVFRGRRTKEGRYTWTSIPSLHFPKSKGFYLSVNPDGTVWLAHDAKALIRYDPRRSVPADRPAPPFRALVREVTTLQSGTVAYGGAPGGLGPDSTLTLPYARSDFRVTVAAPVYTRTTAPEYQYRLAGHSDDWSEWGTQTEITYTSVWEGTYRFQVRARDERGRVSRPGTLTIHIRPPWYRSGWAYLFYAVGAVLLGLGFRHYYRISQERKEARKQALKLEREREAVEKLERANRRLREANRLKENFLANTSHELRTPLTNVLGFVDVLKETATEEQERFLDAIKRNGRRLERTLNALLELSRLRSEEREPDLGHTPVGECARSVASDFEADAEQNGLALHVDTPTKTVYAEANEQYVDQILRNLIENAIKFTEEGCVRVSVVPGDETVAVEVEDTGIGIDEAFLPKLFEGFEQESQGRGRSFEGSGLGLAISSRLATLMNGTIDVESTKGEGSTFTLELPRASDPVDVDGTAPDGSVHGASL